MTIDLAKELDLVFNRVAIEIMHSDVQANSEVQHISDSSPAQWRITYQNEIPPVIYNESLPVHFGSNYKKMAVLFQDELSRHKEFSGNLTKEFRAKFNVLATAVAELEFKYCSFEITTSKNFKLALSFTNNRLLLISKPIYPESVGYTDQEIIYSFFIDRKLVASNVSEIKVFIEGFNEYLAM